LWVGADSCWQLGGKAKELSRSREMLNQCLGHDGTIGCHVFAGAGEMINVSAKNACCFCLLHVQEREVCVPCSREEPCAKGSSSAVHSVVIVLANQASARSCSTRKASSDKILRDSWHVGDGARLEDVSIADSHEGASSKRERRSASTLSFPARCRPWTRTNCAGKGEDKKAVRNRAMRRTTGRCVRVAYCSQERADVLSARAKMR